jgi:hypothetical protein
LSTHANASRSFGGIKHPTAKNWVEPIIKCKEIMLGPQILVSLTSYEILPLQRRAIPPELDDVAVKARTSEVDSKVILMGHEIVKLL